MQLPRASTSALTDGYCPAIVAESLASGSAVDAAACCAVVGRAETPAAMKSEMPIAAIKGRALPIAFPPAVRSIPPLDCRIGSIRQGSLCQSRRVGKAQACPLYETKIRLIK